MRVSGGYLCSQRLFGPSRRMPLRPTPDALRERVFSILGPDLEGATFLDLFAGSGAVGIEAISRGARMVAFVEIHRPASTIIRRNLEKLQIPHEKTRLSSQSAVQAIGNFKKRGTGFDFVWADPPFPQWELGLEALQLAAKARILNGGARLMLECPDRAVLPGSLKGFELHREISAGASRLLIFHLKTISRGTTKNV